jgi:hypothetical protein
MQYIQRYNLVPKKNGAFRDWLQNNSPAVSENAPEGWKYVGTWFTVRGFGKFDVETRWELADYAALGAGWGNETFQKLSTEWFEFIDTSIVGEVALMKSNTDILVQPGF